MLAIFTLLRRYEVNVDSSMAQKVNPDNSTVKQPSIPDSSVPHDNVPQIIINIPASSPVSKNNVGDILNGIAAIMWPLIFGIALVVYRKQVVSLLRRIRKGKAFGAEAEFDQEELQALNREANKAIEEADAIDIDPASKGNGGVIADNLRATVLAEAARSPRLGLMLLSAEIDKLARKTAASTGHHEKSSVRHQIELWSSILPSHTSAAYQLFSSIRNRIVHGSAASDLDILSAIDSGLLLYSALASMPIERHFVKSVEVDLFSDSGATELMDEKGIIVRSIQSNGEEVVRIFPTFQKGLQVGMELSWEWDMERRWPQAWFRDPENGEIKLAWNSAAEFKGKNLDEV